MNFLKFYCDKNNKINDRDLKIRFSNVHNEKKALV